LIYSLLQSSNTRLATMPSLIQREQPFGRVLSRLKKAELVALAGLLGLEAIRGATVLHLREITKWKLHNDAPLFIHNPNYQNLYTKRELQDLRRIHPAGSGKGKEGKAEDQQCNNPDNSISQAASQHHSRSRSERGASRAAALIWSEPANVEAPAGLAQGVREQTANAAPGNDPGGKGPESSGETLDT
jgi:hypothetical protein